MTNPQSSSLNTVSQIVDSLNEVSLETTTSLSDKNLKSGDGIVDPGTRGQQESENVSETIIHPSYVPLPDTIEMRKDLIRGDGLFASRDISIREPIFSIPYPLFMALDVFYLDKACYSCLAVVTTELPIYNAYVGRQGSLKTCTGCRKVKFCSKDCQQKAWDAYHKYECKLFKKYPEVFVPSVRALLRVVLLKDKGKLPPKYWTSLTQGLQSHEELRIASPDSDKTQNLMTIATDVKTIAKSHLQLKTIFRLACVLSTNSLQLGHAVLTEIGGMVDPLFAKVNHSCTANVMLHRPWYTATCGWNLDSNSNLSPQQRSTFAHAVPLRGIQKGEELVFSYSPPTLPVVDRRTFTNDNFCFKCSCSRCLDDIDAVQKLAAAFPCLLNDFNAWAGRLAERVESLKGDADWPTQMHDICHDVSCHLPKYLDHPEIYTASTLDSSLCTLSTFCLMARMLDEALLNVLRSFFLICPTRLSGVQFLSLYTWLSIFDILDCLLGLDCNTRAGEVAPETVEQALQSLSDRGMDKESLLHWRQRLAGEMCKKFANSAVQDLLPFATWVAKRLPSQSTAKARGRTFELPDGQVLESVPENRLAENAIRKLLQLSKRRWKVVLQETGC
jgi:hypothetical protein